jgi:peptidoglycan hydrolase CwlO-like protein
MSYRNRSVFILLAVLFVVMAISGCDRHKAERAELSKQIATIDADLMPLKEEQSRVAKEVETLSAEVQKQSDALQPHLDQRTKLQDDLALYVQEHQTTALVLKMTQSGVAAVLDSKANQKTKDLVGTANAISKLVATAYCLRKGEECRNATLRIMALGSQIDSENQTITLLTAQLDQKKASLQERQQKSSSLDGTIATKTKEREGLKQRLDSIS